MTMRALSLRRSTCSTDSLSIHLQDVAIPLPSEGHLLIKIHTSAIQPGDVLGVQRSFPHTIFPRILGRNFAGIFAAGRRYVQEPGVDTGAF